MALQELCCRAIIKFPSNKNDEAKLRSPSAEFQFKPWGFFSMQLLIELKINPFYGFVLSVFKCLKGLCQALEPISSLVFR